jgi:ABC-type multidrug transport system fused ATPase/permease subunit
MKRERYTNTQFLKDVWNILGRYRYKFAFWYLLALIGSALGLVPPFATAKIIDFFTTYSKGSPLNEFYFWVGVTVLAAIMATIVRIIVKYKTAIVRREVEVNTRIKCITTLLKYSVAWHEKEHSGSKVQRIGAGSDGVKRIIRFLISDSTNIIVGIVGVGIAFTSFNLKYTFILLSYMLIYLTYEIIQNTRQAEKKMATKAYRDKVMGKIHEFVSNITTVKSLGMGARVKKISRSLESKLNELRRKEHLIVMQKWGGIGLISELFLAFFLIVVGFDIVKGSLSLGMLALFMSYFGKARRALGDISSNSDNIIDAKYSIYRMTPFLKEIKDDAGNRRFPPKWKEILFENLSFKYKDKFILNNINLRIKKGDKIGLVGRSGGGKSTIFKLLVNLYRPTKGSLTIDGKPIPEISRKSLADKMTIVPQEVDLFNLPLKDNITFGASGSLSVEKAIKMSLCDSIVKRLPFGIDTIVGERGVRLSGGEKQRVGIARALYADADIILLDESTSHLDTHTEQGIQDNLEKLKNKTVIAIAHRLSTLRHFDKILVMRKGQIAEQGSFAQLMKKKGIFYELNNAQKKKKN